MIAGYGLSSTCWCQRNFAYSAKPTSVAKISAITVRMPGSPPTTYSPSRARPGVAEAKAAATMKATW